MLYEDSFNYLEIYLRNIFDKKLEIINADWNKNMDYDLMQYLGKSQDNYINISTENQNNNYDCIFLKSYIFPDENNDYYPNKKFFKSGNLNKISNNLKNNGIFCFNIIARNKYIFTNIFKKLELNFNTIISHNFSALDIFVVCFKSEIKAFKSIELYQKLISNFSDFRKDNNKTFINVLLSLIPNK